MPIPTALTGFLGLAPRVPYTSPHHAHPSHCHPLNPPFVRWVPTKLGQQKKGRGSPFFSPTNRSWHGNPRKVHFISGGRGRAGGGLARGRLWWHKHPAGEGGGGCLYGRRLRHRGSGLRAKNPPCGLMSGTATIWPWLSKPMVITILVSG